MGIAISIMARLVIIIIVVVIHSLLSSYSQPYPPFILYHLTIYVPSSFPPIGFPHGIHIHHSSDDQSLHHYHPHLRI